MTRVLGILLSCVCAISTHAGELRFSEVVYGADLIVMGELREFSRDAFSEVRHTAKKDTRLEYFYTTASLEVDEVVKGPSDLQHVPVAVLTRTSVSRGDEQFGGTYPILGKEHEGLWLLYRGQKFSGENSRYFECQPLPKSARRRLDELLELAESCKDLRISIETPCVLTETGVQRDGGTRSGVIVDATGSRFSFCIDGRGYTYAGNEPQPRGPALAYWGATNATYEGAVPILIGSDAEDELIRALQSCAESAFPDSVLEQALEIRDHGGEPTLEGVDGLSWTESTILSIYVTSLRMIERRSKYGGP